jgi:hypothetical protein
MEDTENDSDDGNYPYTSFLQSLDDYFNEDSQTSCNQVQLFDLSSTRVSPISNSTLRDVFGHIVSFYDKSQSDIKYLIGGMAIKMKEIVCEGIKVPNSLNIDDVKQLSVSNINNLMKDVVQRYQQAFAHKAMLSQTA